MENVEHTLKLADEYQVTGVLSLCIKCLDEEPKDEDNVIKIFHLANHSVIAKEDERLGNVRYDCYQYVRNMELHHIVRDEHFKDLEKECMKILLIKKADRLERFLKRIYPQFFGLLEYCMCMALLSKKECRPAVVSSSLCFWSCRIRAYL